MFSWIKSKAPQLRVGLEIRADGMALAVATKNQEGGRNITFCEYLSCSAAERVAKLSELVEANKLAGAHCHLVLPAEQYQTYPVEKPKVDESELNDAIRWKVKDMLDFDLENAVTDAYAFPEDALRGRPPLVNVTVARKALIQGYVNLLKECGLSLQCIDVADLALRNVCVQIPDREERPTALLYLRNGSGNMILVKGDTLYLARHFDFSVQALNEPSQQDSVMQQLALEIQRSFDYFESQMAQVPPQEMVLAGPDPSIPLANMLGGNIAARVAAFDWSLCFAEGQAGVNEVNCLVAAGAALRETEH
ncbi:MAG: hypothetical protein R3183_06455 [Oleiphilaceae bacterium]|nr:hypothetical protein [Oleiphilaceae bacterium]